MDRERAEESMMEGGGGFCGVWRQREHMGGEGADGDENIMAG